MIKLTTTGDYNHFKKYLERVVSIGTTAAILERYAKEGVKVLSDATPLDTGRTASSWDYSISKTSNGYRIDWLNSNINKNVNIAVILQTGHGTRQGGYVQGIDYINPAVESIFQSMAEELWKEMTGS